ncbi:MAG: HNH endonuclease [Prolixibacteraceae bacterium]|nr:HNH endonuclease [Prolixibacteraceae bacterium]
MEILLYIFIGLIVIGGIFNAFKKNECDICGIRFSERAKKHRWDIDGEKTIICSKCNRKLENQEHKRKFDEYFRNIGSDSEYEPPLSNRRISTQTKNAVWRRDEGKCIQCGSRERLEFDHIIPISKGGSNTSRNIQLLCEKCNRQKSNKIQ